MTTSKIVISQQDYVFFLKPSNIILCQSDNCYTTIHMEDGTKILVVKSLTKFHRELPNDMFIRVNQSFLINKLFISGINKKKKYITVEKDIQIPYTITLKELMVSMIGKTVPQE